MKFCVGHISYVIPIIAFIALFNNGSWTGIRSAYAFHREWDQGHDTFKGNPGGGGTNPGPGGQ